MVRVCFLISLILIGAQAFAQQEPQAFQCLEKKAASPEAMSSLQEAYEQLEHFGADFLQYSYLSSVDTDEVSEGKVLFKSPGRMRWDYERPHQHLYILNGDTFSFLQPEIQQAVMYSFEQVFLSELPVAFLLGLGDVSEQFSLKGVCTSSEGLLLSLEPAGERSANDQLAELSVLLSVDRSRILGARVLDQNGNVTAILFGGIDPTLNPSEEHFALIVPEGFDLVDRRGEGGTGL